MYQIALNAVNNYVILLIQAQAHKGISCPFICYINYSNEMKPNMKYSVALNFVTANASQL